MYTESFYTLYESYFTHHTTYISKFWSLFYGMISDVFHDQSYVLYSFTQLRSIKCCHYQTDPLGIFHVARLERPSKKLSLFECICRPKRWDWDWLIILRFSVSYICCPAAYIVLRVLRRFWWFVGSVEVLFVVTFTCFKLT